MPYIRNGALTAGNNLVLLLMRLLNVRKSLLKSKRSKDLQILNYPDLTQYFTWEYSKCERPHGLLAFFILIILLYLCVAKHKELEL